MNIISERLRGALTPAMLAVALLALVALAGIWILTQEAVRREREGSIQAEITKNSNLALAHAERASRSIQVLDQILLAVRTDYQLHGKPGNLNSVLSGLQMDRAFISVVSLINARGGAFSSSIDNLANYADRDYFQKHKADPVDRLLIGVPIIGRLTGQWVITLTRPIVGANGAFAGVVFMSLSPRFFATEYEKTTQGPHGAMALIGLDGITRARRNGDKVSFGENISASQLLKELPNSPVGDYLGVAASDGVRRLASYRVLDQYPMIALVASSYEDVLALSAERESVYVSAGVGASLVVVLSSAALIAYLVRRRRLLETIQESERRYRLLFENSLDAVISTQPEGRLVSANPAARAMFGIDMGRLSTINRQQLFDRSDLRLEPLLSQEKDEDHLQGPVRMLRLDGRPFEAEVSAASYPDGSQLSSMIIRDVTDRKLAEDQIRNLAFYDPLTLLPNRRLLMDRLGLAMSASHRYEHKGALLFVDLDNFKTLNDTLGHFKGDLLLQQVAQRLVTCIREGDTCARLGGDEFVVMLEHLSNNDLEAAGQAEVVGEKILAILGRTYKLGDTDYDSTPSIGITLFAGHEQGIDQPLKRADMAMYQAKAAGRNTLRFFDPQIQAAVEQRANLEVSLREALHKQQFLLHYQPQVHGLDRVTGVEALVRWSHPLRGMVSPAEFIPLAEETGLILPLGLWVMEVACTQLAAWAGQPALAHLTISVNVSERQFRQVDFVAQVQGVLQRTGARADRLKLELTESLLARDVDDIIAKMRALKTQGVGFSLDDFGTGYSSLAYLKQLPLDQLKIDQSFVRDVLDDPNDAAIARMVIVLAESLGLSVIAEGVETAAQSDFLAKQGCLDYQGYLFSRPLPPQDFEVWLAAERTSSMASASLK